MTHDAPFLRQSTCVAIGGRGLLIEGAAGAGKSSLALALIDRGAVLVGDDGISLSVRDGRLLASPAPATRGLLEVRNVGIVTLPAAADVPVALAIRLGEAAPRFIEEAERIVIGGADLPLVALWPDSPVLALRAEAALARYGLA
jgi:serine kinase of HPr protein (carbohydrate metabolism regulator)